MITDTLLSAYGEIDDRESALMAGGRSSAGVGGVGDGFWFSSSSRRSECLGGVDVNDQLIDDSQFDDRYDDDHYLPYVYGVEGVDAMNWQDRCIELEMSLQRFRDQAGKIRGLLREKVSPSFIIFIY